MLQKLLVRFDDWWTLKRIEWVPFAWKTSEAYRLHREESQNPDYEPVSPGCEGGQWTSLDDNSLPTTESSCTLPSQMTDQVLMGYPEVEKPMPWYPGDPITSAHSSIEEQLRKKLAKV